MSLPPEDSFQPLMNVRKDLEQMFAASPFDMSFFNQLLGNLEGMMGISLQETVTEIIATCQIPGLQKGDDVQIHVEPHMLTIRGAIDTQFEQKDENLFKQQRYASSFHRAISLPSLVLRDGVKATYRDDVLEVRMRKTAESYNPTAIDIDFY